MRRIGLWADNSNSLGRYVEIMVRPARWSAILSYHVMPVARSFSNTVL